MSRYSIQLKKLKILRCFFPNNDAGTSVPYFENLDGGIPIGSEMDQIDETPNLFSVFDDDDEDDDDYQSFQLVDCLTSEFPLVPAFENSDSDDAMAAKHAQTQVQRLPRILDPLNPPLLTATIWANFWNLLEVLKRSTRPQTR